MTSPAFDRGLIARLALRDLICVLKLHCSNLVNSLKGSKAEIVILLPVNQTPASLL